MEKTFYEILEVSENASQEVIEKAYKVLVKRYHPDLQEDANKNLAETKIKQINEAYEILSDDIKRKQYDEELNQKRQYEKQLQEDKIIEQANKVRQNFVNTETETNNIKEDTVTYNEQPIYTQNIDTNLSPEQLYWKKQEQAFQVEYQKEYMRIIQQYPDEKMQKKMLKKIERKLNNKYLEKYDSYLRKIGYKVKVRWTFEKVRLLLIFIASIILLAILLWKIPVTHNMLMSFYENNRIIKAIVDIIGGIFNGIITGIGNTFAN